MNNDWFVIKDFNGFVESSRIITYNSYGNRFSNEETDTHLDQMMDVSIKDQNELDKILSYNEAYSIIKSMARKQKNKKTNQFRYLINDQLYIDIIQSLGDRMTSNILQGLVQKGLIETGFDSEINDFIFWVKDQEELE